MKQVQCFGSKILDLPVNIAAFWRFLLGACEVTHYVRRGHDKWVPVTTAWRVLRLRMEERPPIWRVAANILNKQSMATDKGWSSISGVGRCANNSSP